jgi:hypothetical protein
MIGALALVPEAVDYLFAAVVLTGLHVRGLSVDRKDLLYKAGNMVETVENI